MRIAIGVLVATTASVHADWALNDAKDWVSLSAHARIVGGVTSGDFEELAAHAHDPNQDVVLQGLEVGANLRLNDHIQGFATVNVFQNFEDELDAEWEEGFLKLVELPGGFEVRGGRYLNRFGGQNSKHLHSWDFVDANLVTANFLGDEGLVTEGGEVTWIWDGPVTSAFSLAFGSALEHDHHGEHEEEEHEDEEEEDDHDHDHGHGGAEDAFFSDEVLTGRWLVRWDQNDFHRHEWGLNFGLGENGYGRDTTLYSGDYYYTYRSNGLEPGGKFLRVGGELYYREVEWHDEDEGIDGSGEHWGAVVSATYGFAEDWETSLRYGWIQGESSGPEPDEVIFEVEERHRVSAALTKRFRIAEEQSAFARVQANFDDLPEGNEQSVFLQIGFDWGGPEIR
ncbi:hypothetical protein AAFN60_01480 [Roseibacillus persicicus]|uniref:hypothetical protein n=1 Tax=Roseibacillus persicicus TaxID=454148 RepID=UPI00398BB2A2